VHIVYQGQLSPNAFLIQAPAKRIFFMIPFHGNTLIGTTDTDYKGNPDDVKVGKEDIEYLLKEASRVFPAISFDQAKIISTFAGLRPLVFDKGSPSKISRKHGIEKTFSGLWYVLGGKFTTYRAIAEDAIKRAMPQLTNKMPFSGKWTLYGSGSSNDELKLVSLRYGVSIETIKHTMGIYGCRYVDVLELTKKMPELKEPICTCTATICAQVKYALQVEMAQSVDDIVERRLQLQYNACSSKACIQKIKEIYNSRS
jgi:glycerol-3-phosphate dehydrogenase